MEQDERESGKKNKCRRHYFWKDGKMVNRKELGEGKKFRNKI